MKYQFCKGEGVVVDCPDCSSPAVVDDTGLTCSNPECPNS